MDMPKSVADVQKSVSEAVSDRLSRVDISKVDMPRVEIPKVDLGRVDVKLPKMDVRLREVREKQRNVEELLPRRRGPSPLPFVLLGMIGGLVVGIWAATSATFGPAIRSAMDEAQKRLQGTMPVMADRAREMQATFQHTISSAGRRAEQQYERTASSTEMAGRSTVGSPVGSSSSMGAGSGMGAGSSVGGGTGAAGSMGMESDLGSDGGQPQPEP